MLASWGKDFSLKTMDLPYEHCDLRMRMAVNVLAPPPAKCGMKDPPALVWVLRDYF
jgi:hypothetical protein